MECLSIGDFADFTAHLEGFSSIYQLNADKKSKSKAFQALQVCVVVSFLLDLVNVLLIS